MFLNIPAQQSANTDYHSVNKKTNNLFSLYDEIFLIIQIPKIHPVSHFSFHFMSNRIQKN